MTDIENELLMLERYNLTPEEWLVTRLLILANVDEGNAGPLKRYLQIPGINSFRDTLIDLQKKGVIKQTYRIPKSGERFIPEDVDLNKVFMKQFYKCSGILGQELFLEYPEYIISGGVRYILNNITKNYNSLEELYYDYGRIIKFNPETHKEIMELLRFGKENNLISYGICEFIKSMKWITIKKMKEDDSYLNGIIADNIVSI